MADYCAVCTFPFEYCPYGAFYAQCKETEGYRRHAEDSGCTDAAAEKLDARSLAGGVRAPKTKREKEKKIVIKESKRKNKKIGLTVSGLEAFGHELKSAAKTFGTTFACGCSVVKNEADAEIVFVQADVFEKLVSLLSSKMGIPAEKIEIERKKPKAK